MTSYNYNKGDLVRISGTVAGTANMDPTTVYAQVMTPAGSITTYQYGVDAELVKGTVGVYYVDVSLSTAGKWHYRFYSTGTGQAASDDQTIIAKASVFD